MHLAGFLVNPVGSTTVSSISRPFGPPPLPGVRVVVRGDLDREKPPRSDLLEQRTYFLALPLGAGEHPFAVAGCDPGVAAFLAGLPHALRLVGGVAQDDDLDVVGQV